MRILYLAHRVPFPPNKGDKIRSYHHLRHLASRHEVHVLAFYDRAEDAMAGDGLSTFCHRVHVIPLNTRTALARGALTLVRGRSLSEGYFGHRAMRAAVADACARQRFDVAWAYSSPMAAYIEHLAVATRVVDYVDVDSEKWLQFSRTTRPPLSWAYGLEAQRLRRFEAEIATWADHALFVSRGEADLLREITPDANNCVVVPNGVDTAFFQAPAQRANGATLLFTGALDYRPNADAVLSFAHEVLPLIQRERPDATFVAVGHHPSPTLLQAAAELRGVRIAGSVPDIRPYFRDAAVYVAPLTMGRGLQNKILEAMAMRIPVVASPLATAGLAAQAGTHLLVADNPSAFAAATLDLLRDPLRADRLVSSATALLAERYAWERNLTVLDSCLHPSGMTAVDSESVALRSSVAADGSRTAQVARPS